MKSIILIGGLVVAMTASVVHAQNTNFLSKGPIAYMSKADDEIWRAAFDQALDETADGETVEWSNPDTGHGGTITVVDTHEDYGTTCRTLRLFTEAAGRSGGANYRLCKAADDSWQFAPLRRKKSS
jgi:surface antigen